eukprot:CAMPEP_0117423504 /NCGR_PEP_ID=MMETSP0758-20121206/4115_1 /TAXON_ID=63605 /ORGANISM="Percolomonas cosmopolitus, Strain AE-1 (ATCC 50343)" /LENGTH=878 /DNA_ID=CAMNT_0005206733 /DNA_START=5 /DNA_END=2641 /DNA_ORIENTATION=+
MNDYKKEVLDTTVVPEHYDLHITPNFEKLTFKGHVKIQFKKMDENVKAKDELSLNCLDIKINSAVCYVLNEKGEEINERIRVYDISYDTHMERVTLKLPTFDSFFGNGNPILEMEYDGILNDKMKGFYKSTYKVGKESKIMGTTQFEATDARRALPCFDEPSRKATFKLTLTYPRHMSAISNTNAVKMETNIEENTKTVEYAQTPRMSTYLLAWVIGEFDFLEGNTKNGLRIRVFTPLGKTNLGTFALDVALRVIPLFEDLFQIPYPLPKLDLIAIADFSAGAMENWGLLTYRETALLLDPNNCSVAQKQRVAQVVAHECSHMWFGNLVTMDWWHGLWLNESFARFLEYYATNELFPEWNLWNSFVDKCVVRAFHLDSLRSTHAIEVACPSHREVDEIFDGISYAKGGSVIRQLRHAYGIDAVVNSLRVYLKRFAYKNTTTTDLFNVFAEVTKDDMIPKLMQSWTTQEGYPVLSVTRENKHRYILTQERFFSTGPSSEDSSTWIIPVSYITNLNDKPTYLTMKDKELIINVDGKVEWIKFNPHQTSFYRVRYQSTEMYTHLGENLSNLTEIDRMGLQEDVCSLALAGYLDPAIALSFLKHYTNEESYFVLNGLSQNLGAFHRILRKSSLSNKDELLDKYCEFARAIFLPAFKKLGWDRKDTDSDIDKMLRTTVINALVSYKEDTLSKSGLERFNKVKHFNELDSDLRVAYYRLALRDSEDKEAAFKRIRHDFLDAADENIDRVRILSVLGTSPVQSCVESLVAPEFIYEKVPLQDVTYALSPISQNRYFDGQSFIWNWFSTNFDEIQKNFDNQWIRAHTIKIACAGFASNDDLKTVESFFANKDMPTVKKTIAQAIESIKMNILLEERCLNSIVDFLQ